MLWRLASKPLTAFKISYIRQKLKALLNISPLSPFLLNSPLRSFLLFQNVIPLLKDEPSYGLHTPKEINLVCFLALSVHHCFTHFVFMTNFYSTVRILIAVSCSDRYIPLIPPNNPPPSPITNIYTKPSSPPRSPIPHPICKPTQY